MNESNGITYDRFERVGDTAGTVGLWPGVAGFTLEHDGDVYCPECTRDIVGEDVYETAKQENTRTDEHGNVSAVLSSEEWDCPGATCGHCGIQLDVSVLHYGSVCDPDWCELEG